MRDLVGCRGRESSLAALAGRSVFLFFILCCPAAPALAEQPRLSLVLVIYQDSSTLPAAMEMARGLSNGLGELVGARLELYTEFLDAGHFSEPAYFERVADMLTLKYGRVPMDVVVALGPEAVRFVMRHRSRIAGSAALLFGDISERSFKRLALPEDVGGVITAYDIDKTMDLAIALQPGARGIVVVSGSAEFDRYWQESARQKLGSQYRRLPVEYLSALTLESFVAHARELPTETILLILTIFEDAGGRKYRPRDAAAKIAEAPGAPS